MSIFEVSVFPTSQTFLNQFLHVFSAYIPQFYSTIIYDDIVPTNEMYPHYKKGTKMPLPIQIFLMNSGNISKSPKPKQWDKYKDYTDHIPVKADYCIEEC